MSWIPFCFHEQVLFILSCIKMLCKVQFSAFLKISCEKGDFSNIHSVVMSDLGSARKILADPTFHDFFHNPLQKSRCVLSRPILVLIGSSLSQC